MQHLLNNNSTGTTQTQTHCVRSTGRKFIHLELVEEKKVEESLVFRSARDLFAFQHRRGGSPLFSSFSRRRVMYKSGSIGSDVSDSVLQQHRHSNHVSSSVEEVHKGTIIVSWYHGTNTVDLHEHVKSSIVRKLGKDVENMRLLDSHHSGPDDVAEVVLTPHIPSGSRFVVKCMPSTPPKPIRTIYKYGERAPDSPSAAPAPTLSTKELDFGNLPPLNLNGDGSKCDSLDSTTASDTSEEPASTNEELNICSIAVWPQINNRWMDTFNQLTSNMSSDAAKEALVLVQATRSQVKRHVIITSAIYFLLVLSVIAIFVELHERAPSWLNDHNDVQTCVVDQEARIDCGSNGESYSIVSCLARSLSRSTVTSRVFLFGFDTRQQLWTVVYESFVTGFCGGFPYMFICRGLNPDTRHNFLSKYWKDAMFGSLAGFNAYFLKAVLKNMIPREAVEDAFKETKQLGIANVLVPMLRFSPKNIGIAMDS